MTLPPRVICPEQTKPAAAAAAATTTKQQRIGLDMISLDYKDHFTASLTLDTLAAGSARHADRKARRPFSLPPPRPSPPVAFGKGHLQEALDLTGSDSICML